MFRQVQICAFLGFSIVSEFSQLVSEITFSEFSDIFQFSIMGCTLGSRVCLISRALPIEGVHHSTSSDKNQKKSEIQFSELF